MQYSYWEKKDYFSDVDFAIIGGGIVGLSTGIELKEKYPKAKVVIYERSGTPQGASTKNAGFACFGSVSEVLDDLDTLGEDGVVSLISERVKGLRILRERLGDSPIDYQKNGGYELFRHQDAVTAERCLDRLDDVNKLVKSIVGQDAYQRSSNPYGFENILPIVIKNHEEGQIDTGKMMAALSRLAIQKGVRIIGGIEIVNISDHGDHALLELHGMTIKATTAIVTNNGFARKLLDIDVDPARAQVVITSPIAGLPHKGTFHIDRGYNYFRNIHGRILLGGGRNLDFQGEKTTEMQTTEAIQEHLRDLLKTVILPRYTYTIDLEWSGIMGMSSRRSPIVKQVSDNVYCAVRLGGMGIALGSRIARTCVNLL